MNVLAIETFSRIGSLAVWRGELEKGWVGSREISRSEDLLPNIEKILFESELERDDLEFVAVSVGPGSFTGLRVGISIARGLALSLGVDCIGVSALESQALAVSRMIRVEKVVTSLIALSHNNWCQQTFRLFDGRVEAVTEINMATGGELFAKMKESDAGEFVVDAETFERFLMSGEEKVVSAGQDLARWVGLLAIKTQQEGEPVGAEVLPKYLV